LIITLVEIITIESIFNTIRTMSGWKFRNYLKEIHIQSSEIYSAYRSEDNRNFERLIDLQSRGLQTMTLTGNNIIGEIVSK
jgi:hypothetical protein